MQKLLIIANDMEIGGAERALLGLLYEIDLSKYEVDLFLLKHSGPLLQMIPKTINLLKENRKYASIATPMKKVIKEKHFDIVLGRLMGKWFAKRYKKKHEIKGINSVGIQYSFKYTKACLPFISDKEYDLVISFSTPFYIPYEKVHAKKRVAWIHTDYSVIPGDRKEEEAVWRKYDKLVAVSDDVRNAFLITYPKYKKKISIIENILPESVIIKQSKEFNIDIDDKGVKLLSIGRFSFAKNFDNIPAICSMLKRKGLDLRWYIIGYGSDEEIIKKRINEYGMENNVILLGKQANPYPYILWCDCYVQPSRFEGKSVAVKEAQLLGKPVIITNYNTAQSQLENGVDGIIVPLENEECANGIYETITNKKLLCDLAENCKKRDYTNRAEIEKVYELFDC